MEIKRLHQRLKNTMVYVTHDQIEALTLADRIAIMRDGVIQQLDTPHGVYNRPVNLFVAGFIGSPTMNFFNGIVTSKGTPTFTLDGATVELVGYEFAEGGVNDDTQAVLGIRPEHVAVGDAANDLPYSQDVEIEIVEPMGADTLAWTKFAGQTMAFRSDAELDLRSGNSVKIGFDPGRASIFSQQSGARL
ncbi:MAG TPA: ABC transporter ATP-binding protein [Devosiaceae bacterium]|nr:ABC transporter ATP-binding protein [Devosiaceae bacterium]